MELLVQRYDTGMPVRLAVEQGRIASMAEATEIPADGLPRVAPAFFDLQINGYGGTWFSDERLTVEQVLTALEAHFRHGITRMCPTLITNSTQALEHGFATLAQACRQEPWADRMVAGCHLEGPYISPEDGPRGAHALQHVRPCDLQEFARLQRAAEGRIRLVTLAPEAPGAIEFIQTVTRQGVVVALGHTAARTEQILAAVQAGARLSTHLGNAAHPMLPRHPNYLWDQLGEPRLWASVISDGFHLPASVVRSIVLAKGCDRTIITCDASGLAGLPPGVYEGAGGQCEVLEDGRIVVAGQRLLLAGSGVQTDRCVEQMLVMTGVSLPQAFQMAGENPARLLGCEVVRLEVGSRADLIFLEDSGSHLPIKMKAVLADGVFRHGTAEDLA